MEYWNISSESEEFLSDHDNSDSLLAEADNYNMARRSSWAGLTRLLSIKKGITSESEITDTPPCNHSPSNENRRAELRNKTKKEYGDDIFDLNFDQLCIRIERLKKTFWNSADPERKKCVQLGLRNNNTVICPFCKAMVKNLGKHLDKGSHPIFFYKCPFCPMNHTGCKTIHLSVHIMQDHPNEVLQPAPRTFDFMLGDCRVGPSGIRIRRCSI